ncbi:FHA domain-containing protein [Planctomycetota bacterium]
MRLTITQNGKQVHEAEFVKGPIHIGRHSQSQVFLASPSVSRQQAVLYLTEEGQWMIKDLQSANKTHVNGQPITEKALQAGDHIKVGDYLINFDVAKEKQGGQPVHLEDTHAPVADQPKMIVRELDNNLAPAIRVPARRARDLQELLNKATKGGTSEETLKVLLDVLIDQFQAHRVWCAFRLDPEGFAEDEPGRTHLGPWRK